MTLPYIKAQICKKSTGKILIYDFKMSNFEKTGNGPRKPFPKKDEYIPKNVFC